MSKINIANIIKNIKSKSNAYTPIVEAVVNSIDAIGKNPNGKVEIVVYREELIDFENIKPSIKTIKVIDNGVGFTSENRESFDTYLSAIKSEIGGKGFGRFMYLKYFHNAIIESQYQDEEGYKYRNFRFGKEYEIIVDEQVGNAIKNYTGTELILENIKDKESLDKGLEVIARKLVEKLLVFFVDTSINLPQIILRECDNSASITLNNYISDNNSISKVCEQNVLIKSELDDSEFSFTIKVFKIYFSQLTSRIVLAAHNRDVTETALHSYIPEFKDNFYEVGDNGSKNYIVNVYVIGEYLNENVSLERESFNFDKEKSNLLFPLSQIEIEKEASKVAKASFDAEVRVRYEKKIEAVKNYVRSQAPWHKTILKEFNFKDLPTNLNEEKIELELQRFKFIRETETRREIQQILSNEQYQDYEKFQRVISQITENGKNDLAHYVSNRKLVIDTFDSLRKRREVDDKAHLEAELHNIVFPMGATSETLNYEDHNLWLLDERLVFSQYISSDKVMSKIEKSRPDIVIFHNHLAYRNGDNNTNSPLSIFEFKRPKRSDYPDDENPINQACRYVEKIRQGKYEMPEGLEPIKVSKETPTYIYIICDLAPKIKEFADLASLTESPDNEGYFGFMSKYNVYVEIMSYKKLIEDAKMRNRIFFKKLRLE